MRRLVMTITTPDRRRRTSRNYHFSSLVSELEEISGKGGVTYINRNGSRTTWPSDSLKIKIEPERTKGK